MVTLPHMRRLGLLAIAVACAALAIWVGADVSTRGSGLVCILFLVGILGLMLAFPRLRLGLFLMLWLGAPPLLDYELAYVAPTAVRTILGLRSQITQPVFSLLDLSLLLGVTLLLLEKNRKRLHSPRVRGLISALVLLTALAGLSGLNSAVQHPALWTTAMAGVMWPVRAVLAVLSVVTFARPNGQDGRYLGTMAGLALLLAESVYVTALKSGSLEAGIVEMTGVIPGPAATGGLLVLIVPIIAAYTLWSRRGGSGRTLSAILALIGLGYALLTYSRSVYLGTLTSAVILVWCVRNRGGRALPAILALLAVLGCALGLASSYHLEKIVGFGVSLEDTLNLGRRMTLWSAAIHYISESPLLGMGPLMWGGVTQGLGGSTHNAYLQYAAENGLPALILLLSVLAGAVLGAARQAFSKGRNRGPDYLWTLGLLAGVCGFLVIQFFESTMGNYRIGVLIWSLLATVALQDREEATDDGGLSTTRAEACPAASRYWGASPRSLRRGPGDV